MALLASLISVPIGVSVALVEICVGIAGGNLFDIQPTPWIMSLAAFGSVVLTFLAGAEIDVDLMKHKWKETLGIGLASFLAPCLSVMAFAYWVAGVVPSSFAGGGYRSLRHFRCRGLHRARRARPQ